MMEGEQQQQQQQQQLLPRGGRPRGPPPLVLEGIARLDEEEKVERNEELKAMLWHAPADGINGGGGGGGGGGGSSSGLAGPGSTGSWSVSDEEVCAVSVAETTMTYEDESYQQVDGPMSEPQRFFAASSAMEMGRVHPYPCSSSVSALSTRTPSHNTTQPEIHELEGEGHLSVSSGGDKEAEGGLASTSLLLSMRPSADPAELMGMLSQLAVALRTSEMARRHLTIQCRALQIEQGRLNAQVQSLARRDRELEEHVLLLQARVGDDAAPRLGSTLSMLRAQMLEAARAEADRARQDAEAAAAERDRVVQEMEAVRYQNESAVEALRQEVGRLMEQLAQRAVLGAAQERERKERERRQEQELRQMDALVAEGERLRGEVERLERAREKEAQLKEEARRRLAKEEQAAQALGRKIVSLEGDVAGAQARLREVQAELDVVKKANATEDVDGGEERFAMELERVRRGFVEERAALEAHIERLSAEMRSLRHEAAQQEEERREVGGSSSDNLMREFIEDGSDDEDQASLEEGSDEQKPGFVAGRRDGEGVLMEAEVSRRVESERCKIAEAFQEELRSVLAGARKAFEQEKAGELAEVEREWEAERVRRERTRVLEMEGLRARLQEERQVALQAEREKVAADMRESAARAEREAMELMRRVEEELDSAGGGPSEWEASSDVGGGGDEGALVQGLKALVGKLRRRWWEAGVHGATSKGPTVHAEVQTCRDEPRAEVACQTTAEQAGPAAVIVWEDGQVLRLVEAAKVAAAAEVREEARAEGEQVKEALVERHRMEVGRLEGEMMARLCKYEADLKVNEAVWREQCAALKEDYQVRILVLSEELHAAREKCEVLEERQAAARGVEEEVRALQARMEVEIDSARRRHEEVVMTLEEQVKAARAEAEEAVRKARAEEQAEADERWRKARQGVLGDAEKEWRAKLEEIQAKMKLLQAALLKVGRKAAGKDDTVRQLRSELEDARRAELKRREVEAERREALVREVADKERRAKELEKALQRVNKELQERQQQQPPSDVVLRREVEAVERRLKAKHEKDMAVVMQRAKQDMDQEVELVINTMRRRYARKIEKQQAKFEREKEALILATMEEAKRVALAYNKRDGDVYSSGGGKRGHVAKTPPTPRVCLRENFFDY